MLDPREADKDFYYQILVIGSILLVFAAMFASGSFEDAREYGIIKFSPRYSDGTVTEIGRSSGPSMIYVTYEFTDHRGNIRSDRKLIDRPRFPTRVGSPVEIAYSAYLPGISQIGIELERKEYSFHIFCASLGFAALLIMAVLRSFKQIRRHEQTSRRY